MLTDINRVVQLPNSTSFSLHHTYAQALRSVHITPPRPRAPTHTHTHTHLVSTREQMEGIEPNGKPVQTLTLMSQDVEHVWFTIHATMQ